MGHSFPYAAGDRIVAGSLNFDARSSPWATPPSGSAGGAGQFKTWMDTSTNPPTLRIATAAHASPGGAYVASEWAVLGTLDLTNHWFNYEGTFSGGWNGNLTSTGVIQAKIFVTDGSVNSGFIMYDKTTDRNWTLVGVNDTIDFGNGTGSILTIDPGGTVATAGDLHVNNINMAGISGNSSYIFLCGNTSVGVGPQINCNLSAMGFRLGPGANPVFEFQDSAGDGIFSFYADDGSVFSAGKYYHFMNTAGAVNAAGGPLIYGDGNYIIVKPGSGDLGFGVQNYAGAFVLGVSAGGIEHNSTPFAACDPINTGSNRLYDNAGNPSIFLGGGTNYYRNNSHHFQTVNGATEQLTIDVSGNVSVRDNLTVGSVGTFNATGTALYAPNGNLVCQNIQAANDSCAGGVFRRYIIGTGPKGARVECWAGDWDSIQFGMTTGHLSVSADGGTSGFIFNSDSSYSDVRLKDNIRDTDVDALEVLRQTPVRAFEWNAKGRELMPWASPVECGLIAQELKETIPVATGTAPFADEPMYINNQNLTPYLIRAIQQIADRLDAGGL